MNPVAVTGLSPWEILGLKPGSSAKEIQAASRSMAMMLHPDLFPQGAGLFQVVQAASEACRATGAWPRGTAGLLPPPGRGPGVPKAPPAPRPPAKAKWRQNLKGNWSKKLPREIGWTTAYLHPKTKLWRWMGPDLCDPGEALYSDDEYSTATEAMDAADSHYHDLI